MEYSSDRSEIAFFDVETTSPTQPDQGRTILEFGAILVCPKKLVELDSYSTLVRPDDRSLISTLSDRRNGITRDAIVSAPTFAQEADKVYDILNGRIWAGHNILRFDCVRIREAYADINRPAPEPSDTIDSLDLLTQRFGKRAGDMKMATLATFFGLGRQTHRSIDDVRMNLEVLKYCATVLFLESSLLDKFLESKEVSLPSISVSLAPFYGGPQRMQILHRDNVLKICCTKLKVRFNISSQFLDHAGRPKLSFVVDAPPSLCGVLDKCDSLAQRLSVESGSSSEWRSGVTRKAGFFNSPTVRLQIPTVTDGNVVRWDTEIYDKKSSSASPQRLVFSRYDVAELEALFTPGTSVDAYFSLDLYDYQQNAGIRLVAKKLFVHST